VQLDEPATGRGDLVCRQCGTVAAEPQVRVRGPVLAAASELGHRRHGPRQRPLDVVQQEPVPRGRQHQLAAQLPPDLAGVRGDPLPGLAGIERGPVFPAGQQLPRERLDDGVVGVVQV
jgi:hypothetical protein